MFYSEYNDKVLEEAKKVCDLANERLKNLEKLNAIMNSDCSLENVNGKFTLDDKEKNMLKILYEETLKNCDEKIVTLLDAVSRSNYHGETVGTTSNHISHCYDRNDHTTRTEINLNNSDYDSSESSKNAGSYGSPKSSGRPVFDNNTTSDDPADDDLPF